MSTLSGFWNGAAHLSGRIDLSMAAQDDLCIEKLSDVELAGLGLKTPQIERLRSHPSLPQAGPFICLDHDLYPRELAVLPFAPPVLFYRGDLSLLKMPAVAVVGSRQCTQRGREMAKRLAKGLISAQVCICSGLAYGIDESAQMVCPERSIAVLGQGFGADMSRRLETCVHKIIDSGGLVLSEFPPSTSASKYTFPQRNRIISGLSKATIVVEASLRSGSRITARHALDQGREVMAVPGHPSDPMSKGCNALIADGAALIQGPNDALAVLGIPSQISARTPPACATQHAVLEALKTGETLDHIAIVTGHSSSHISIAIQSLELTGHLVRLPGERYRIRDTP